MRFRFFLFTFRLNSLLMKNGRWTAMARHNHCTRRTHYTNCPRNPCQVPWHITSDLCPIPAPLCFPYRITGHFGSIGSVKYYTRKCCYWVMQKTLMNERLSWISARVELKDVGRSVVDLYSGTLYISDE